MPRDFVPNKRIQQPFRRYVPDRCGPYESYNRRPPRDNTHPYPTDRCRPSYFRHYLNRHDQQRRGSYNRGSFRPYNRDASQSDRRFHAESRRTFRESSPRHNRIEYNQYTPRTTMSDASSTGTTRTNASNLFVKSAVRTVIPQRSENAHCANAPLVSGTVPVQAETLLRQNLTEKKHESSCNGNPSKQCEKSKESVDTVLVTGSAPDTSRDICSPHITDRQNQAKAPTAGESAGIEEHGSMAYTPDMDVDHCEVIDNADDQLAGAGRTSTVQRLDSGPHSESQDRPQIPEPAAEHGIVTDQEVTITGIFNLINESVPLENRESILRGLMGVFIIMKDWVPPNSKDAVLRGLIGKLTDALKPETDHCIQRNGMASQGVCPISDNIPQSQASQHCVKTATESVNHVVRAASIQITENSMQQSVAKPRIRLILSTKNPVDTHNKMQVAAYPSHRAPASNIVHLERNETSVAACSTKLSKLDLELRRARGASLATPGTRAVSRAKRPGTPYPHPQLDAVITGPNVTRSASAKPSATQRDIGMPLEIRNERNKLTSYQCSMCPQRRTKKSAMALHMECHGTDGRFRCHECDFATDSKHMFNSHLQYHPQILDGERSANCEQGEIQRDGGHLQAKKPALPCVDPSCSYLGENCKAIAEHVQRAHPICSNAVKEITAPSAAVEEAHTFQCSDCPAAFVFEGNLMIHTRRMHPKRHHLDAL